MTHVCQHSANKHSLCLDGYISQFTKYIKKKDCFSELRLVSRGYSENVRAKWGYNWLREREAERNGSYIKVNQ